MKSRVALIAFAVAVLGGLAWMLFGRPGPSEAERADETIDEQPFDREALLDRKRRARQGQSGAGEPAAALGRVTDAQSGAPIADAIVLLTPKGLGGLLHAMNPGQAASPLSARTDADGQWTIEGLPPGGYTLSASAAGYLPATRTQVVLRPGTDEAALHLALRAGGHQVRGTVADIGGGPVEDVLVRLSRLDEGSPFNFDRPGLGATTDEDGRFAIQLADGLYRVQTYHPDYVEAEAVVHVDGGPRALHLSITPAATIEGRVIVRSTGAPLAGATVTRSGEQAQALWVSGVGQGPPVVTDEQGRFVLRGLDSGVLRLHATARGYSARQPVEVVLGVAEHVDDVELVVDRAPTVSGFVVARGDEDRGVGGVLVGAFSVEPPRLFVGAAPSADDGYFEIFGVLPGTYTVGAVGEDTLPNMLGTSVTVDDADVPDVLLVMDTGVTLRGTVTPAVPARVSVEVAASAVSIGTMLDSLSNAFVSGRTDPDGAFSLHPVADGTLTVVAEADDGSRGEVEVDVRGADLDGLSIALRPRASLGGHVVEASGEPGRGLEVSVRPTASAAAAEPVAFTFGGLADHHVATTDERGAFIVRGLDPGEYQLSVSAGRGQILAWAQPEHPSAPKAPQRITLAAAETRDDVTLRIEARNARITGTVVGADGQPLADAWVTALRQDVVEDMAALARARQRTEGLDIDLDPEAIAGPASVGAGAWHSWAAQGMGEPPVLTDEAGRFEVTGLREGLYHLRAEAHKDGARGFTPDVPAGSDARVVVVGLGTLRGVVMRAGAPVTEYTVVVRGPGQRRRTVFDPDGSFSLTRLDAGVYEVTVQASDGAATAEVDLEPGQAADLELELRGWGTLRGRVVDAGTGDPLEGLTVTAVAAAGPDARAIMDVFAGDSPTTDADGAFEVGGIVPGEGTVMVVDRDASGAGGVVAQRSYAIEAEQALDLGTITGVAPSYVEPDERGTVGLSVRVASYGRRPRAPRAVDDPERAAFDLTPQLWVTRVLPQGPAARAGVVPGDQVIAIDGTAVGAMGALNAATLLSRRYLKIGEALSLSIEHAGERRTIELVVEPGG